MVPQADKTLDSESTPLAKTHEQCLSPIHPRTVPPPGQPASSDGLPLIRKSLQSRGISQATQDTILSSWRATTQKQYRVYLEKWQSFADRRAVDSLHTPIKHVLESLQELYERGLGYSCLNTARLSSFIVLDGNVTVGNHPLVQRFLKGAFHKRPAFPRYTSTWDTSVVLTYLQTLHPPKKISLQNLTLKPVMLCALVTGQRCQTLHLMNLGQARKNPDSSYIYCIDQLVKQSALAENSPFCLYLDSLQIASYVLQQFLMNTLIVPPHYGERGSNCSLVMLSHFMGCPKTLFRDG